MLKNTAYGRPQMIFFLALLPGRDVADFLSWARSHLSEQPGAFQNRLRSVLDGLILAANGQPIDGERLSPSTRTATPRRADRRASRRRAAAPGAGA